MVKTDFCGLRLALLSYVAEIVRMIFPGPTLPDFEKYQEQSHAKSVERTLRTGSCCVKNCGYHNKFADELQSKNRVFKK